MRTLEAIITDILEVVASPDKEISPQGWLRHAMNLNWLLLASRKRIIEAEHGIAVKKNEKINTTYQSESTLKKTSNAEAQNYIETLDEYKDCELMKAEVKTIEEFIRIAKKYSESVIELGG